jgi:RHH-type transcriptional regulator, rel operon repressor / antitoxin RelB
VEVSVVATSVRLATDVEERLDRLAARTGRTKAYYLRELIVTGLDRVEWEYDVLARASEVRRGEVQTVTLDEVARDL